MELLSVIRRWRFRDHYSIREISRRTGLSRNTVGKYLRSDEIEPKFSILDRPSKLDAYADKLSQMLRQEAGKSRKQKRTIKQLHADLAVLGYDGSYNRVAAFAREWQAARQREQKTIGRGVFVPLTFLGWRSIPVRLVGRLGDHRRRTHQVAGRPRQTFTQPRLRSTRLSATNPRDAADDNAFGGVIGKVTSDQLPTKKPHKAGPAPRVHFRSYSATQTSAPPAGARPAAT